MINGRAPLKYKIGFRIQRMIHANPETPFSAKSKTVIRIHRVCMGLLNKRGGQATFRRTEAERSGSRLIDLPLNSLVCETRTRPTQASSKLSSHSLGLSSHQPSLPVAMIISFGTFLPLLFVSLATPANRRLDCEYRRWELSSRAPAQLCKNGSSKF